MMRLISYFRNTITLAVGAFVLAACATPTAYQAAKNGHGYAEQPLEEDRVRVTFSGNSLTPRETVENYLLFRAAEVTAERGYGHFIVVEQDIEKTTTYRTRYSSFGYPGHGYYSFYRGYARGPVGLSSATTLPRERFTGFANIVMRKGKKKSDNPNAYDAEQVIRRLGRTIVRDSSS